MAKKPKKTKNKKLVKKSEQLLKPSSTKPAFYHALSNKHKGIIVSIFLLAAGILYIQSLSFGYVLDDKIVISENDFTKKGFSGIGKILTTDSFTGYFGEQKDLVMGGRYRPLSIVSFAIENQIFGLNPTVSHLVNNLLYGLSAFLLFLVLRRVLGEQEQGKDIVLGLSFLTAFVFLVHPLHTEAVANIKGRDEIMSFLFSFLSLHLCFKYFDQEKIKYLIVALISFFLGLLSKENTITFLAIIPFAILLFRKVNYGKLLKIFLSLLVITVVYLILRTQIIGYVFGEKEITDLMNNPFVEMSIAQKFATIFYTLLYYLKLHIIPYPLTHDYYPYHIPISNWSDLLVILSLLVHLALGFLVLKCWKSNPIIGFSIGFYFLAISIVSNLFVNVGTFMNERFVFTASAGLCLLIVYMIKQHLPKKIAVGILSLLMLAFAVLSFMRIPVWENELELNTAAIKVSKNSARSNSFMGTALFNQYKVTEDRAQKKALLDEAEIYVDKALEILPNYGNANIMRAGIAAERHKMDGDLEQLLKDFKSVIKIKPSLAFITEYMRYVNNTSNNPARLIDYYYEVGYEGLVKNRKNIKWGMHYLNLAFELDNNNPKIRHAIGKGYEALGQPQKAKGFLNQ